MGSANPLPSAKQSQTDELDLPQHLRLNRRSREPDLPANPRPMVHIELAKAAELEGESIRVQMGEQGGLEAQNHHAHHVLSLFLGRQGQSTLNSLRHLVSTFWTRTHGIRFLSNA